MAIVQCQLLKELQTIGELEDLKGTDKWIDTKTRRFRKRSIRVRGNKKNQFNTVDPFLGCPLGTQHDGLGCFGACYAAFTCRKLQVDFEFSVKQELVVELLRADLRKVKVPWIRIGIMCEPSVDWELTIKVCRIVREAGKIPVVITRFWRPPTSEQLRELAEAGVVVHASVSALDSDESLRLREKLCREYLTLGGLWVWRTITFHFTDLTDEGLTHWDKQDLLMSGEFGMTAERQPLVLETPARIKKGKKVRNPFWHLFGEWAYFKAPTTKDHKFSKHNHDWTAGVLYPDKESCWMGCERCPSQCATVTVRKMYEQTELAEFA